MRWLMVPRDGSERGLTAFQFYKRGWCLDCGKRELVKWLGRDGVCTDCYWRAMARMERDEERKALRFATDEQLERF